MRTDAEIRADKIDPNQAWIIRYDDKDRPDEVFYGHGATDAAARRFEQQNGAWNCHLFKRVRWPGDRLSASPSPVAGEDEIVEAGKEAVSWRCFHCDEAFTDREAAAAHFGYSECSDPACRVDGGLAAAYRELEARWSRCLNECCENTKAYHAKESERRAALVREEQRGYDKGVSDMRTEIAAARASADAEIAELRANLAKAEEALEIVSSLADLHFFDEKSEFYQGDPRTYQARKDAAIADLRAIGDTTSIIINEGDWVTVKTASRIVSSILSDPRGDARIAELTPDPVETK